MKNKIDTTENRFITAKDIEENPKEYYGKYVAYTPANGCDVRWRIFDVAYNQIYLISEDYVENKYFKNIGLKTKGTYSVYSVKSRKDLIKRLRKKRYYRGFEDKSGKAKEVFGAAKLSEFLHSYNRVHDIGIAYVNLDENQSPPGTIYTNAEGYVLRFFNSYSFSYHIQISKDEDLYVRPMKKGEVYAFWLADFSASNYSRVMKVDSDGYLRGKRFSNNYGLRPLVILKQGVSLKLNDEGIYELY